MILSAFFTAVCAEAENPIDNTNRETRSFFIAFFLKLKYLLVIEAFSF
jgi:hypothetical protein